MNEKTLLSELSGVGKTLSSRLARLGLFTVHDLMRFFPFRYEDYRKTAHISSLVGGEVITVKGVIQHIGSRRSFRKGTMVTEAILKDETGDVRLVWFQQPFLSKSLHSGDEIIVSGKVKLDAFGFSFVSPLFEKCTKEKTIHTAKIVPLYPLTSGITQKQMRFLVSQIVSVFESMEDPLSFEIREKAGVIPLKEAFLNIHLPNSFEEIKLAEKRFRFDEIFMLQLRAERLRKEIQSLRAKQFLFDQEKIQAFVKGLPFELTKDQKISAWEMIRDTEKDVPMNRLLQGDVGSGKTVVAGILLYHAFLNKTQSLVVAPTEVLASQHFETFLQMFQSFPFQIALFTRSRAEYSKGDEIFSQKSLGARKKIIAEKIRMGEVDLVIGTHAILNEDIGFSHLGFAVVDEQHRFGVDQRRRIREKNKEGTFFPHYLSMSATPIPRSFALTLFGDLDLSVIKTKPPMRKPVKTRVALPHEREKAYEFIGSQIKSGRQVFVVCPLIEQKEDDEQDEKKTVVSEYEKLSTVVFPEYKVAFLHGKMKAVEKERIMGDFAKGKIDVLVSTSVIEVGVNVQNASVMMIEGAERFGLSQLHQFRGRVGRGADLSYCILFPNAFSSSIKERLNFFEKTDDGFLLAEYDFEHRGQGDVYGTIQSGQGSLRLANLLDIDMIHVAKGIAENIDLARFPALFEKVKNFEQHIHLE